MRLPDKFQNATPAMQARWDWQPSSLIPMLRAIQMKQRIEFIGCAYRECPKTETISAVINFINSGQFVNSDRWLYATREERLGIVEGVRRWGLDGKLWGKYVPEWYPQT